VGDSGSERYFGDIEGAESGENGPGESGGTFESKSELLGGSGSYESGKSGEFN